MKIRNERSFAVEVDHEGETFECAARPGVVDVPDALGESLLLQEDSWSSAEDDSPKRPSKASTSEKEG